MGRRAILIRENNGEYEISPGAQPESYKALMAAADFVRVVKQLTGQDYEWVIETDLGWYFVTGWKRPKEKSMGSILETCVPAEGPIIRFTRQRDALLMAKEYGGHVHREATDDGRTCTYCVCDNPDCNPEEPPQQHN
jgi:hypothetical protein